MATPLTACSCAASRSSCISISMTTMFMRTALLFWSIKNVQKVHLLCPPGNDTRKMIVWKIFPAIQYSMYVLWQYIIHVFIKYNVRVHYKAVILHSNDLMRTTDTIKQQISAWDLFMQIMWVKHRSCKFVPHKFLSLHTLLCIKC